ncbi:hypothetical protein TNCV_4834331 [Trichonephila clavipes]|nr:hypothetical protein TNCV_4834331 [Trichonephila clavipes]
MLNEFINRHSPSAFLPVGITGTSNMTISEHFDGFKLNVELEMGNQQVVSDSMMAELKECFMEAYDDNKDGKIEIREGAASLPAPYHNTITRPLPVQDVFLASVHLIYQCIWVSHGCLFALEKHQSTSSMPAEHATYHDTPTRPLCNKYKVHFWLREVLAKLDVFHQSKI